MGAVVSCGLTMVSLDVLQLVLVELIEIPVRVMRPGMDVEFSMAFS
jgi:uncharacterized membrane protein YczE